MGVGIRPVVAREDADGASAGRPGAPAHRLHDPAQAPADHDRAPIGELPAEGLGDGPIVVAGVPGPDDGDVGGHGPTLPAGTHGLSLFPQPGNHSIGHNGVYR